MKLIYYKHLLRNKLGLTANERIIYSFLVSKSILSADSVFSTDGLELCGSVEYYIEEYNGFVLCNVPIKRIADIFHLSIQSVYNAFNKLEKKGLLFKSGDEMMVKAWCDLLNEGFFELKRVDDLKGELLIFYSFLYDFGAYYNFKINAHEKKLATLYGMEEKNVPRIEQYVNQLKKGKFIYRRGYYILFR